MRDTRGEHTNGRKPGVFGKFDCASETVGYQFCYVGQKFQMLGCIRVGPAGGEGEYPGNRALVGRRFGQMVNPLRRAGRWPAGAPRVVFGRPPFGQPVSTFWKACSTSLTASGPPWGESWVKQFFRNLSVGKISWLLASEGSFLSRISLTPFTGLM